MCNDYEKCDFQTLITIFFCGCLESLFSASKGKKQFFVNFQKNNFPKKKKMKKFSIDFHQSQRALSGIEKKNQIYDDEKKSYFNFNFIHFFLLHHHQQK